ncbi:MAG TPA: DinB family protein [Acidimicrobiales bacterium]|nr:DinB family protein [Acidimicrobiales bacterium]
MSMNLGDKRGLAEFATSGTCMTCGFVPDKVDATDIVVGLRSFPARWRSALALHLDDDDPETVLTGRPTPADWSALEHAGHVRDVLHALDIRVQRVLREDEPVLPETHVTPPSGANEQGIAVVLAALTLSADQFAETVARIAPHEWVRTGFRASRSVNALDLAREAVHEGSHHLRLATQTMHQLRTAPADSLTP